MGCGENDIKVLKRHGMLDPETFSLKTYVDSTYYEVIPVKTRYISTNRDEYLHRVDVEPNRAVFPKFENKISLKMTKDICDMTGDSIFISDYNKGFISNEFLDMLNDNCDIRYRYSNIRPKKIKNYVGKVSFLSFNKIEFLQSYNTIFNLQEEMISDDMLISFKNHMGIDSMIITFGHHGFIYYDSDNRCIKIEPFKNLNIGSKNIIGAGDMVSASFSFFDTMNRKLFDNKYKMDIILYIVNCCAFLKVYTGEYTVSLDLLLKYIEGKLFLL